MIEMNPFYAYESSVGPVFDVATWSRSKAWSMAVAALVFAAAIAAAMIFAWQPTLLMEKPPEFLTSFHEETLKLAKEHPWAAYGGSVGVGLFGLLMLAGASASVIDATSGDHYFRVGPGGISLSVPQGLDPAKLCLAFGRLELEIPMDELANWTIVQNKRLGSMSQNTGNTTAYLKIRTVGGKRQQISLDGFREPAHVIRSKINDALQMVPADFSQPAEEFESPLA